ncbi:MAG: SIS domain-containing protein [Candidatus Latescibacterota bacterium]|nr:MAG: SIS domain-containing protein [Candidatus Latescibacterota bacterium]
MSSNAFSVFSNQEPSMINERQFIESYQREIGDLVENITVTDVEGMDLDGLAEGIIRAKDYLSGLIGGTGKVMLIGNGASASIASHMATDFWRNSRIRATEFNDSALLTCVSNDFCYEEVFSRPVEMFAEKGDVLICISSSGKSPNIIAAADMARDKDCFVITLTGFGEDNPLRRKGDINFYVPSPRYGPVETLHTYVLHCINDLIIANR